MTTTSRAGIGAAVLALSGLAVLGLQAPASAAGPAAADPGAGCPTDQHYPPDGDGCVANGLRLSHPKIKPGKVEVVAILGYKTGSTVTVYFDGSPVGTARMSGHQWAKVVFTIPADASLGDHTITAKGQAQNGTMTTLSITVRVYLPKGATRPATAGAVAGQASTTAAARVTDLDATKASAESSAGQSGLELAGLAGAGVLLMGAGPTAVYAARRRRS